MNLLNVSYAAGVVDSDGTVGVRRTRRKGSATLTYRGWVVVKQVTPEAVDLLYSLWGGTRYLSKPQSPTARPLHAWVVHSKLAGAALSDMLPFLRIKRAQAENVIETCDLLAKWNLPYEVPKVQEGEPLLTINEVATRLGRRPDSIYASLRKGRVPFVRVPKGYRTPSLLIPESFVEGWRTRPITPGRHHLVTEGLEQCFHRSKQLNRVGVN